MLSWEFCTTSGKIKGLLYKKHDICLCITMEAICYMKSIIITSLLEASQLHEGVKKRQNVVAGSSSETK